MANFSVCNGDENSVFVWSSFLQKEWTRKGDSNCIVVITDASSPHVTIYDATNVPAYEIVEKHCAYMSSGCNYRYEVVNKIGNTYFVG